MQRTIFPKGRQKLFIKLAIKKSGLSRAQISNKFKVCLRSLSDWANEKYSMPFDFVKKISKLINIALPEEIKIVSRYWYAAKAGKLGGRKYFEIYGSPGTPVGRVLGGRQSISVHKKLKTNFIRSKKIVSPAKTKELAELFGIILGDGGVTKYQLIITLNRHTDHGYYLTTKRLIEQLFNIKCSVIYKGNCVLIVVNSVNVVVFLIKRGLRLGNKVLNQIDVPEWIKKNDHFSRRCIRGLVDTDGCIYFEKHRYKERTYKNICLNFSNRSVPLLKFVYEFLNRQGIKVKLNRCSVKVGIKEDVKKYFELIGSSNPKHMDKCQFLR